MRDGIPGGEGVMGGKRIAAWGMVLVLMMLSGCGGTEQVTDDYRSALREEACHPLSAKREITEADRGKLQRTEHVDMVKKKFDYRAFLRKMRAAFQETKYGKYISEGDGLDEEDIYGDDEDMMDADKQSLLAWEEDDFTVSLLLYAVDILEKGRREGKLPREGDIGEEKDVEMTPAQKQRFACYEAVKVDNCIFYVYQGEVQESFYVALSRDEEWQQALRKHGLGYVGELFSAGEDALWEHPVEGVESLHVESIFTFDGLNISTGNELFNLSIADGELAAWHNEGQISEGIRWLEKYWDGDGWGINYYTDGERCDILNYQVKLGRFIDVDEERDLEYSLEVLGNSREERVEEVRYHASGNGEYLKDVPSYLRPTVVSYLRGMGVSREEAQRFVERLPRGSGTLGVLKVAVDQREEVITVYRPY